MIRSFIYDSLILRLTSRWYAEVLRRVPEGATLLDVGIGTAGALLANGDLVKRKCMRVVGIDIDADYIRAHSKGFGIPRWLALPRYVLNPSTITRAGRTTRCISREASCSSPSPSRRCGIVARC